MPPKELPKIGQHVNVKLKGVCVNHDDMNGLRAQIQLDGTADNWATKRQVWLTLDEVNDTVAE